MKCPLCRSEDVFQFESSVSIGAHEPGLPMYCRHCEDVSVGGIHVPLPDTLTDPIKELAEAALGSGVESAALLKEMATADPDLRIERYMANHYRAAYLDGFFRALVFFRHNAREGRLYRVRKIWERFRIEPNAL